MTYDAHIKPPLRRGIVSDKIEGIPANKSLYVPRDEATPDSVRTLVSRISAKFGGKRAYQTAKERDGIRIWRTA